MATYKDKHQIDVEAKGFDKATQDAKKTKKSIKELKHETQSADSVGKQYHNTQGAIGNSGRSNSKTFAKQAQGMGGLVRAYAATAANIWAVTAAFTALKNAMDLTILETSMQTLDRAQGTNLFGMAKSLKEVSGGMLTFEDAARRATTVMSAGFGQKELLGLGKAARAASQALGRDFNDSLDRLVRGVIKAEPELLDELGIILRLDDASRKYAQSVGKSVTELSTFEKQVAVMNEVLEQADNKYGDLIEKQDAVNQFSRLAASSTETLTKTMQWLGEALSPLAKFFADNQTALVGLLGAFGLFIAKTALPSLDSLGVALTKVSARAFEASENVLASNAAHVRKQKLLRASMEESRNAAQANFRQLLNSDKMSGRLTEKMQAKLNSELRGRAFVGSLSRNLTTAINLAFKHVDPKTGLVTQGMFKHMDLTEVKRFQHMYKQAMESTAQSTVNAFSRMKFAAQDFFLSAKVGYTLLKESAITAAATSVTMWNTVGAAISSGGLLAGIRVFRAEIGVATAGMGIMGTTAVATAGAMRLLAGAMMSVVNILGILFLAWQGIKFISEMLKSDETKAYEEKIKKLEETYKNLAESADKYNKSLKLLKITQASSGADILKETEVLANSERQKNDAVSILIEETQDILGTLDEREEEVKRRQRSVQKWLELQLSIPPTSEFQSQTRDQDIQKVLSEMGNLDSDIADSNAVTAIRTLIKEFPGLAERVGLATIKNKELAQSFTDVVSGANPSTKSVRDVTTAISNYSQAQSLAATALDKGLKASEKSATTLRKALVGAVVPGASKLEKILQGTSGELNAIRSGLEGFEVLDSTDAIQGVETLTKQWNDLEKMTAAIEGRKPELISSEAIENAEEGLLLVMDKAGHTELALMRLQNLYAGSAIEGLAGISSGNILAGQSAADDTQLENDTLKRVEEEKNSVVKIRETRQTQLAIANKLIARQKAINELKIAELQADITTADTQEQREALQQAINQLKLTEIEQVAQIQNNTLDLNDAETKVVKTATDALTTKEKTAQFLAEQVTLQRKLSEAAYTEARAYTSTLQSLEKAEAIRNASLVGKVKERAYGDAVRVQGISNRDAQEAEHAERMVKLTSDLAIAQSRVDSAKASGNIDAIAAAMHNVGVAQNNITDATHENSIKLIELDAEFQQTLLSNPITIAEGWKSALADIGDQAQTVGEIMRDSMVGAVNDVTAGVSDMVWEMYTAEEGTFKLKEAFGNMAASMIKNYTNMLVQALLLKAVNASLGGFNVGGGGGSSPLGDSSEFLRASSGSGFSAGRFADGGIVTQPTVALFGEAGAEAFVPLPDGNNIPVVMSGNSGGNTNNTNISVNIASDGSTSTTSAGDAKGLGKAINQAVQQELVKQSRPGGLLNRG